MNFIRYFIRKFAPILDLLLLPFTLLSSMFLLFLRKIGIQRLSLSRKVLFGLGVFPIIDHYYEPMFNPAHLRHSKGQDRALPGIDFNSKQQLAVLDQFHYNDELCAFPLEQQADSLQYFYRNSLFGPGDAEYYYNIIRLYKPKRIIEIGAGYSTLMALNGLAANAHDEVAVKGEIICIEPFERTWLGDLPITLMRDRVEEVEKLMFKQLEPNDILFIDSSHMIRPQGDVLCEVLEILPILRTGVIVHIHDVFTPKDYPEHYPVRNGINFFNEQYLIEAFLSQNEQYKVLGALNWLYHHHRSKLIQKCPVLCKEPNEPGSLWMMRV